MSDKYKNGKIYTIRYKNDDSLIYVGSTYVCIIRSYLRACVRAYVRTYIRMYIRMYVCVCVCVCACEHVCEP